MNFFPLFTGDISGDTEGNPFPRSYEDLCALVSTILWVTVADCKTIGVRKPRLLWKQHKINRDWRTL